MKDHRYATTQFHHYSHTLLFRLGFSQFMQRESNILNLAYIGGPRGRGDVFDEGRSVHHFFKI